MAKPPPPFKHLWVFCFFHLGLPFSQGHPLSSKYLGTSFPVGGYWGGGVNGQGPYCYLYSSALWEIRGQPELGVPYFGGRSSTGCPLGAVGICFPGRAKRKAPWQAQTGLCPALRARAPDLAPDHTSNKMRSPEHGTAPADLPAGTLLVPLRPCHSAGMVVRRLGQASPHHRAFALSGHPLHMVVPPHSGLHLDVISPDGSSWSKCPLFPHIPL